MVKKIIPLADWISAHYAAQLLSLKMERPIQPHYVRALSKRKHNPVRVQEMGNRFLYNRDDILGVEIKKRIL